MGVKPVRQKGLELAEIIRIQLSKSQQDWQVFPTVKRGDIFEYCSALDPVASYLGPVKIVQVPQAVKVKGKIPSKVFFQSRSICDDLDFHVRIVPMAVIISNLLPEDISRAESYNVATGKSKIWKVSYVKRHC